MRGERERGRREEGKEERPISFTIYIGKVIKILMVSYYYLLFIYYYYKRSINNNNETGQGNAKISASF